MCTKVHYAHMKRKPPLESHGIRLSPDAWRTIDRLAEEADVERTTWLRAQIESLLHDVPVTGVLGTAVALRTRHNRLTAPATGREKAEPLTARPQHQPSEG